MDGKHSVVTATELDRYSTSSPLSERGVFALHWKARGLPGVIKVSGS